MVQVDETSRALVRRELEGRPGAWLVVYTRLPGADLGKVTHLETLAAGVAAARSIGYFPAGPMYYAAHPSEVHQDVEHSRLAFVVDTPARKVQAYMNFARTGEDVRTASIFRHDNADLGRHDLLLADAEALVVDVAGLSAGFAQVIGYEGEVRFRLEVAVPDGGTMRLRAQDEFDGMLRPHDDCPTTFAPLEGSLPVPDRDAQWPERLHATGSALAERFGVSAPQLIPPPDVRPSFTDVLTHRVEESHR